MTSKTDDGQVPSSLELTAIGRISSPYPYPENMPIEPRGGGTGHVQVDEEYRAGLKDLAGFERIWLLFFCHRSRASQLIVTPFLDTTPRGVFATRAPSRPNALGISAVRLLSIDERRGILECAELDIVDGTPLLDIKPYVPRFDAHPHARAGWLEHRPAEVVLSDTRFAKP